MHVENNYKPGDVVVYFRGGVHSNTCENHLEIGVVKSIRERGCFVAYHLGDTCVMTPFENLCKVANGYAIGGLAERARQLTGRCEPLAEGCEDWSAL